MDNNGLEKKDRFNDENSFISSEDLKKIANEQNKTKEYK